MGNCRVIPCYQATYPFISSYLSVYIQLHNRLYPAIYPFYPVDLQFLYPFISLFIHPVGYSIQFLRCIQLYLDILLHVLHINWVSHSVFISPPQVLPTPVPGPAAAPAPGPSPQWHQLPVVCCAGARYRRWHRRSRRSSLSAQRRRPRGPAALGNVKKRSNVSVKRSELTLKRKRCPGSGSCSGSNSLRLLRTCWMLPAQKNHGRCAWAMTGLHCFEQCG
jgi:hypothetical protein